MLGRLNYLQGSIPSQWENLDLSPDLVVYVAFSALYSFLDMEEAAHKSRLCFWNTLPSHCSSYLEIKTGCKLTSHLFCNTEWGKWEAEHFLLFDFFMAHSRIAELFI